ncbi:MAG: PAS and helix-turn-helix domain-containing protein, partial [Rhizobiaceae bacterium]
MQGVDPLEKAEIIEHIYDVALDPERYEELLDVWEKRIGPLRQSQDDARMDDMLASDPDLVLHARRASEFLGRMREPTAPDWQVRLATEVAAAFCATPSGKVLDANQAAELLLGIRIGTDVHTLHLSIDETQELVDAIRGAAVRNGRSSLLRFGTKDGERAIIFHIAPLADAAGQTMAFVRTSELGWPDTLTALMKDAFKLTEAEVEIIRSLVEGKSLKFICEERQRSMDTVRTQMRSILAKTETRSQSELIRITMSLMDVVGQSAPDTAHRSGAITKLQPIAFQTMVQPGNRRYDFIEFGKSGGRPCLYLPIDYGLIRWPRSAEIEAERRNIRVIVPVRAGFGQSSQLPARV